MVKTVSNWGIEIRNSSLKEREEYSIKISLNYPPHPPMPASRHQEQVLHIPEGHQSPEHSGTVAN